MKSMPIGTVLNPSFASSSSSSSSKPPLVLTAVASGHREVELSSVCEWKTIRTEHSNVKFGRQNHRKLNTNKYLTKFSQRKKREPKILPNATDHAHDSGVVHPQINGKSLAATLAVIFRYSKVYTLTGTAMSIISISLLAVQNLSDFTPSFLFGVFQAIIGGSLVNLYVAALNQLSDIEIDKINKPYLPLASGELSVKTANLLTLLYASLVFWLGWSVNSWPLKLGLFSWFAFGTAYSVNIPMLRWKRIPVLAAMCIWSVQGAIIPILFYLHAQTSANIMPLFLSKHAIFVSGLMSIHAIVIASFKDIPDVKGDKINGVDSFASQIGGKKVFWICVGLLEIAYGVAILIGLSSTHFWARLIMVIGYSILGFILWKKANLVDVESNEEVESFYLLIWKLYSAEYLMVPFLRF